MRARYVVAFIPKCFKCLMLVSSGPVFGFLYCIFCVLFRNSDLCFLYLFYFLSMILLLCIVEYFVVLVNCLFKR